MAEDKANKNKGQGDKKIKWTVKVIRRISGLRDVFLVIFGSMLSILITILLNSEIYNYKINMAALIFSATTAIILFILAFLDGISHSYWKRKRACNAKSGKYLIGIIRACKKFETDGDKGRTQINKPPKWSEITCKGWMDKLTEGFKTSKVEYVSPKDDFTRFNCIVNPYGGAYYEESFSGQKSLHKILKYTSDGGVYVNVADIPFFYAYNIETDMWLYNSNAFNILRHFASNCREGVHQEDEDQTSKEQADKTDTPISTTDASISNSIPAPENSDGKKEICIDYNFYIFKELGITFLMPYLGGVFKNLPEAVDISCNNTSLNVNLNDARPFFASEICPKGGIKVSHDGGEELKAFNWMGQKYNITPIGVVPNGQGRLIISTVSIDKYPGIVDVIIKMIETAMCGKQ